MINIHDLINGGAIGFTLIVIAFVLVYLVFFRDIDTPHISKHHHE